MTDDTEFDFDYAESWKPSPGDVLKGVVTATDLRQGQYDPYPIVTVRQDDGVSLAFHAFHTVAQNQIAELNVQVGDRIGVQYRGKAKTKDGRGEYESYRIRKSGGVTQQVDWSSKLTGVDPSVGADEPVEQVFAAPASTAEPAAPAGSQFGEAPPF